MKIMSRCEYSINFTLKKHNSLLHTITNFAVHSYSHQNPSPHTYFKYEMAIEIEWYLGSSPSRPDVPGP
jgi:hypothetical protein